MRERGNMSKYIYIYIERENLRINTLKGKLTNNRIIWNRDMFLE
jgi:hypothetical protein